MLTVYKFGPAFGLPDLGPFVIKLETWLRMAGLPYRSELGDFRKAPKGKIPYAADGDRLIPDSSQIIDYLIEKHGDRLNDGRFGPKERALGLAMKSMFEADFYFVFVYLRWWRDEDFACFRSVIAQGMTAGGVPRFAVSPLLAFAQRQTRSMLKAQGIGRHTREEVYAMGRSLVDAASELLGDKPFFLDDAPSTLDTTAYGLLAPLVFTPPENPVKARVLEKANLVAFCERIRETYWANEPAA
ncbi:glutathione S-transferase family protein [Polyangium jinanense]|uniref:Glutathione S-transferase N-terminal domain-containing protein n=1 Tax=Polyangium jinanense TaxID=2829994 RepID=A0A9X3XAC7_9BACT|nr:glutathione S-transferase family protein [Polyangium jinanense]MDC3960084.1 glutathione S-transferase N-terminal domain-containing protein [Polyangium jinanense]MDC3984401.1 glutathione S-transferase N-terminal domain-containing protein [Polyangium jinanense]